MVIPLYFTGVLSHVTDLHEILYAPIDKCMYLFPKCALVNERNFNHAPGPKQKLHISHTSIAAHAIIILM